MNKVLSGDGWTSDRGIGVRTVAVAITITTAAAVVLLIAAVVRWPGAAAPAERLVVADARQVMSALLYVAQAKGFFAEAGLEVELRPYRLGRDALAATLEGSADLVAVGESPITRAIRAGRGLSVFATIQTTDRDMAIVVRADRGIGGAADLAGRRIGFISGTGSELFLDLYLASHDLAQRAERVAVSLDDAVPALADGRIDGLSAWTGLRFPAERALAGKAVLLTETGIYTKNWVLAAQPHILAARQAAMARLLRALIRAEAFIEADPDAAIALVAERLGVARSEIAEIWPFFDFAVDLGQTLVVALENAARMDDPAGALNFLQSIDTAPLQAVDAGRVTVLK